MKYCMDYSRSSNFMDEIDEINIELGNLIDSLEIVEFLTEHKNQRINIGIKTKEDVKIMNTIKKDFPQIDNYVLAIPGDDKKIINMVRDRLPFFCFSLISNWDSFEGIMQLRPTDIYVTETLCFELDKVADRAHEFGINIRVFPNVAQSKCKDIPDIKKFFIRPEDVEIYEPYVDTLEFVAMDRSNDTLYRIYNKDKEWFGPLRELILDFNDDIDNRCILPDFAVARLRCSKRCFKGNRCHMCEAIELVADTLEKNNMYLKKEGRE